VQYQKLEYGPTPRSLRGVRERLVAERRAELRTETYLGYRFKRLVPLQTPDMSGFMSEEVDIIGQAVEEVVSVRSHDERGWDLVDYGDTIPTRPPF
jgi:hypothetical protein